MSNVTFTISIAKWCDLAERNMAPPVTITLNGYSMEPFIRCQKDRVTIIPLKDTCRRGDIVLFRRCDGEFIVHRVYRIKQNKVQTFGDGNAKPDTWMELTSVLGRVVSFERNEHVYSTDTWIARTAGKIWMMTWPLRPVYYKLRCFMVTVIKHKRSI